MKKLKTYKTFLIWIAKQCSYNELDEKEKLKHLKSMKHNFAYEYGTKCAKHGVPPVWDI